VGGGGNSPTQAKRRLEWATRVHFEEEFRQAREIVRAETGLKRLDGLFREVTKAKYSSAVIEYYRKLKEERRASGAVQP
jgi:hypothetical protein